MEELIQWNKKPALPDKQYAFTTEVGNVMLFAEPDEFGRLVWKWQSAHSMSSVSVL